jgi:hypothetical protein
MIDQIIRFRASVEAGEESFIDEVAERITEK